MIGSARRDAAIAALRADSEAQGAQLAALRADGEVQGAELAALRADGEAQAAQLAALRADGETGQARSTELAETLTALAARMDAGLAQQEMAADQRRELGRRLERLERRVDQMEVAFGARLDAQASATRGQATVVTALEDNEQQRGIALAALEEAGGRHAEAIRQLRADIARLGLQAASDLGEMRAADAALAELVLARAERRAVGVKPADPEPA